MSTSQSTSGEAKERVLSDFARVNPPTQIPKDLFANSLVSFIPMADVSESGDWINRQSRILSDVRSGFTSFRENDVLVAKITPCLENGKGAHATDLVNGIGFGSTEFHVLRPMASTNARFLFHVTQSRRLRSIAESYMIGSAGQQRVQAEFFHKYKMPALRPAEQTQTATVLDTLDTAIRQTEAIIEKLKQVKQGLLHDLLTRGIDDNGELRPLQSEAPHLYKQSTLGWIPKEWTTDTISSLLSDQDPSMRSGPFGSALLKSELVERGIPLLGIDNVHVEGFVSEFVRFVSEEKFLQLSRYAVRPRDLMITIMGTVGRCCLVPDDIGRALSSKHTWTISLDSKKYDSYLAMLQVNYSPWVLSHFARDEQGGIMSAIRSETIRSLVLPGPSREEQTEMSRRLVSTDRWMDGEKRRLHKLRLKRAGFSDDLLTGRVRVTPLLRE